MPCKPSKFFPVKVTITGCLREPCTEFKIGDSWIVEPDKTPDGMCNKVYSNLNMAMRGMKFSGWNVMTVSCPAADSIMIYELRRINDKKSIDTNAEKSSLKAQPGRIEFPMKNNSE